MGSSCSSGQKHKDKDSASTRSEDSPTYQGRGKGAQAAKGANHHHGAPPPAAPGAGQTGGGPAQPAPAAPAPAVAGVPAPAAKPSEPSRGIAPSATSDSVGAAAAGVEADDGVDVLPQALQKLPDHLRRLVLGRPANTLGRPADRSNKIAIYVCAADSQDCCVEKGVLHRNVYPELRAACRARGYELHVVDLHWRTPLEKQQDHQFPELCLGELARQQETAYVVPVLFLNMSLGTPLLPNTIETQDFEMALGKADDKTLLNKWYSLDSHAQPPCYRLRPTTCHIPGLKEDREGALSEWQAEIERTLAVLQSVLPTELRDTYLSTALEQEVHNTVCMSQEMARRTVWLHRVYTHQPPGAPAAAPSAQEAELRRRLDSIHQILKSQLVEKHILRLSVKHSEGGLQPELPEHAQYIAEVTAQLTSSLRSIVDAIIDEDMAKTVGKPGFGLDNRLVQELTHQASVCQQASQCSVNRDSILSEIKSYVEGSSRAPLVVTGPRGCGKSTLVARAAQCCATWLGSAGAGAGAGSGPPLLALRFCGVSAESMTLERVLASVGHQCQLLCDGGHCWASHSVDSWREQLPDLLAGAAAKRTLVVMVDGLDQLKSYGALVADWVPAELPVNVKLVVTLWDGSPLLADLKDRSTVIQMPKLDQAEAASILNAWVMQYNHSVPKRVQDCVLASVRDCTLPLYAKLLAWQTSWEWEQEVTPRGNLDDQLHTLLDQLDAILGKEQVAYGAALLCAAKYGVSDSEMLDLLAHDPVFHSTSTHVAWAPACLFWARFNKLLAPFLQWVLCGGELVLQWRDATVRAAVEARYLDKATRTKAAKALLDYFKGSWWSDRSPALLGRLQPMHNLADKCYNARRLQELPFVSHAVNGSIKQDYLLDLGWVFDKVCGADVFQVLEDIALERSSDADVQWLAAALREAAPALAFDGRQLHSQLFRRLTLDFPAASPPVAAEPGTAPAAPEPGEYVSVPEGRALPRAVLAACVSPPAPALLPFPAKVPDDVPDRLDLIVRIRDYPDYVVAVSTAREEIAVWDILRSERVRVLRGVPQPLSLQPVDSHRCIVLCQRELRIYDLDSCSLLAKLKGVMNQKMPYYGLHDQSHLVALSRNRMYVNLMNLDSGDCVTTFKAGEDRFLNSLLVSGDGRVLVCGDETQKPFPLLVWNLASRKLLYDLRIPHHDFVTSLAAITHEGHYVCCVAQEVDEPSANFIVVYDLQSGTLFKKWKPGVNTVSLNISSRDGCVISGLQDGRVLVWDLITGNCRWTLSGHTAPVDYLRLDAHGGIFLSADSKCRDRSLRLWDLNKGTLVAVFTARQPVTACEVTHGGEVLVLAEEGAGHPTTLRLKGRAAATPPAPGPAPAAQPNGQPGQGQPSRYFGNPEHHGRIVDFR